MSVDQIKWSKAEQAMLRRLYPACFTVESLLPKFPGRSRASVQGMARCLKIARLPPSQRDMSEQMRNDMRYVKACKRRGGFPAPYKINGRVILNWPYARITA